MGTVKVYASYRLGEPLVGAVRANNCWLWDGPPAPETVVDWFL